MQNNISDLSPRCDEQLAILNELGRMALASSDLDQLFRDAVNLLRARLNLQYVMIGTFDYAAGQHDDITAIILKVSGRS
jgi:hypothetical protein